MDEAEELMVQHDQRQILDVPGATQEAKNWLGTLNEVSDQGNSFPGAAQHYLPVEEPYEETFNHP